MKIGDKSKTRILNQQFSSVFSIDDQETPEIKFPRASDMDDIILKTGGVKKLFDDLNVYKPNGPDGIPARMLASLTQSDIPDTWREALIHHWLKEGKKIVTK